jgi:hypothetical protein
MGAGEFFVKAVDHIGMWPVRMRRRPQSGYVVVSPVGWDFRAEEGQSGVEVQSPPLSHERMAEIEQSLWPTMGSADRSEIMKDFTAKPRDQSMH